MIRFRYGAQLALQVIESVEQYLFMESNCNVISLTQLSCVQSGTVPSKARETEKSTEGERHVAHTSISAVFLRLNIEDYLN